MRFLAVLGSALVLSASAAVAQEATPGMSLEDVLALVVRDNPDVQAAEHGYSAARARLLTQRPPLADPVFVADYEGLSSVRPGFSGFAERVVGIEQTVELPFKWLARNDIAEKESRVAEMDFEIAKLDKVTEARKAYGGVLTSRRERELARDNLELAEDFLRKAQVRLDAGDVPPIEVLRARIEVANAERDTLEADKNVLVAEVTLNTLMGRQPHAPLDLTEELSFAPMEYDIDTLRVVMMQRHPLARSLSYAVKGGRSAVRLSAFNFLPDINLGVSRQRIRGEGNFWIASVGFDVPLWSFFRQRGELKEAKAHLSLIRAEQVGTRNELVLALEAAYHGLHVAERQVRIYTEGLLSEAEEVYRISSRRYEEGEASYLEVLEAGRTLRTTRTEFVQALFAYQSAWAELDRASGGALDSTEGRAPGSQR
jgi:outer membrane protein, heavy metal efflux system